MPDAVIDPEAITRWVLAAAFACGLFFGAITRHSRFCTMGAVADAMTLGDAARLRMWVLAMAVATLGFNTMVGLGWLRANQSVYAQPTLLWLSSVVGGVMFGVGMVFASGCGSRNLVRLGGGSLKALVVLLVMGVAAFATLRGVTAVLRVATVDRVSLTLPGGQDLPTLLAPWWGRSVAATAWPLGWGVALLAMAWVFWRSEGRRAPVWWGGLGAGGAVVALWWVSGVMGHLLEDPRTLDEAFLATRSRRMESLSLSAPLADALEALLFFSDQSQTLSLGVAATLGIVAGAALHAVAAREFRWEGFGGVADLGHHLLGALFMGVGGVTALGCSVGQGLSGVSTLSLGSLLAVVSMCAGAMLGLRYQMWRIDRDG